MIGTKKKLIVPVVAIMMCAVALAGVAYALESTVIDSNNDANITKSEFVMEVYDSTKTAQLSGPIQLNETNLTVTTAHVAGNSANAQAAGDPGTVVATITVDSATPYIGKVVVRSTNIDDTHATVSCANISDVVLNATGAEQGCNITLHFAVTFHANEACTDQAITEAQAFDNNGLITLYYKIDVTATGSFWFKNNTPLSDSTAIMNAITAQTFNLSFTATSTTPQQQQQP